MVAKGLASLLFALLWLPLSCAPTLPRVSLAELDRLAAGNRVVVLDVRTPEEYVAGHIPGAILVPVDQIDSRIDEIKALKSPIITYCSCPEEEESLTAVASLDRLGVKGARALTGGFPAWIAQGRPVVKGSQPL